MDDCSSSISTFCTQLRGCCGHLEASCASLRSAVDQRPSSLPFSNLPSLLTTLINRVSLASQEVGNLESKTIDTISFQELLGHCMEIYKQNETSIYMLEDRLKEFGYKPVVEESANGDSKGSMIPGLSELSLEAKPKVSLSTSEGLIAAVNEPSKSFSTFRHVYGELQSCMYEGPAKRDGLSSSFYPETLSLEELGLSAAGLACLAQEESSPAGLDYISSLEGLSAKPAVQEASPNSFSIATSDGDMEYSGTPKDDKYFIDQIEEDEYCSCPTWLKIQISLEDLNAAIDSMCEILANKVTGGHKQLSLVENYILDSEDLSTLNVAGTKLKPCLLFLVRLGRLRTGHENGATVYHVVHQ